ncbi:MAG: bifunctional 4-hydroxy-2-oxoglutarate aldolase/2-dehydro-3-deoxy-phosphogluconate aldolase [Actinobacteria bacterium]|nr:bifunctional 4-hydroxy-2-oxoglutarate aldolase/2-dehydro-3-deoxy-phosphogluconate aldolase [Actinomycetota bacterium]
MWRDDAPALPSAIIHGRLIAIARGLPADRLQGIAEALRGAGVRALEVTLDSPGALEAVEALASRFDVEALAIGAGTVRSQEAAQAAVAAGAGYLVAPHTDEAVVAWAAGQGVPMTPGALTPTEVVRGWEAGAAAVKLFPAGPLGPSYLKAVAEPLPDVPLIPTGGVSAANAADFLRAGAVAVGVGGSLLGDGDPAGVAERARRLVAAVA